MKQTELLAVIKSEAVKIEAEIAKDINTIRNQLLAGLIKHSLFNGGKRVRPLITVLAARLCAPQKVPLTCYRLAMVFEYLHAASLLHDDVLDSADRRRGQPAANKLWGSNASILAGDYLHARAMLLAGSVGGQRCLKSISRATSAMIEAEFLQMQNAEKNILSEDNYFLVIRGKTAALIEAACETGAIHADADLPQRTALCSYGNNLGLAFQIIDDILDYLGDPEKTGKGRGNDLTEGKMTLPLIRCISRADSEDRDFLLRLLGGDRETRGRQFLTVQTLINRYDGFDYAAKAAEKLIHKAIADLEIFTDGWEKGVLTALAHYVLTRDK